MNTLTSCECVDNKRQLRYNYVVNMSLTKSCSFFGHSKLNDKITIEKTLFELIESLIVDKGYRLFYFGGFGEFDDLCYKVVSKLKETYGYIKRVFCVIEEKHKIFSKRPKWLKEEDYEDFVYFDLKYNYWYTRIYFRNCEIIKKSDFTIFFVTNKGASGAYKALSYAMKAKKEFVNIGKI